MAAIGTAIGLRVRAIFGTSTRVDVPWQSPGFDLAEAWEVEYQGKTRIFAMAMTDEPVPGTRGRRLMGYFELERLDKTASSAPNGSRLYASTANAASTTQSSCSLLKRRPISRCRRLPETKRREPGVSGNY